jgi:tetratricopeptide (TPR) repeat protein
MTLPPRGEANVHFAHIIPQSLKYLILLPILLFVPSLNATDSSTATLIEQGHYKRAEAILTERLKANPNDARASCEMSKVSEAFRRWDDAIRQAEKAVSLDPKNAEFQAAVADAVGSKLSAASLGMFEKMSLARRFKKEAELALQLDPNNVDANEDLMEFHLDAPGLVGGDKKKAAELADRMVRINPARGYLMKVEFATHEKHTEDVESFLQQAIAADPRNYFARMQAANFYLGRGGASLTQAEEQAKQAIRIDPGRAGGYTALATAYAQQGRWKDLDSVLEAAQREVPDDLAPFYQAAKSILTGNQSQELQHGEKYMRTYLSQPPEGNEPGLAAAHWRLGLILEKEGHKDRAKQELQEAVRLEPAFEPAKKDLKRLQ